MEVIVRPKTLCSLDQTTVPLTSALDGYYTVLVTTSEEVKGDLGAKESKAFHFSLTC